MRLLLLAAACAAALPASALPAAPDATRAAAEAPARIEAFFRLLDQQDEDTIRAFVAREFAPEARNFEPTESMIGRIAALARQSGGIEVTEREVLPDRVRFAGHSRQGRVPVRGMVGFNETGLLGFSIQRDTAARPAGAPAWPGRIASADEAIAAVRREIAWRIEAGLFSGTILLEHDGAPAIAIADGMADESTPIGLETRFQTASTTKLFTTAAIGMLIDEGRLSLHTPVAQAVPAIAGHEGIEGITIADLLGHRVSFGDFLSDPRRATLDRQGGSATALLEMLRDGPPHRAPAGNILYSNANFLLLAAAIEQATGTRYYDFVTTRIFEPLGMADTVFGSHDRRPDASAQGWKNDEMTDPLGLEPLVSNEGEVPNRGGPPGGVWSTAPDLMRFLGAFSEGRLVSPATLAAMAADRRSMLRGYDYASGLMVREVGARRFIGHDGGGGNAGISSAAFASTDGEWRLVVLANRSTPAAEGLALSIMEFLLGPASNAADQASSFQPQ